VWGLCRSRGILNKCKMAYVADTRPSWGRVEGGEVVCMVVVEEYHCCEFATVDGCWDGGGGCCGWGWH
jgi:hypothetical protein